MLRSWTAAFIGIASLVFSNGCVRKIAPVAPVAINLPNDNSYQDLAPGHRLRITVPILNSDSNNHRIITDPVTTDLGRQVGNTIVLSAANLAGYEVSFYEIEGRKDGTVRLKFEAAQITRDGKTSQEARAMPMSFRLPRKAQHIRLIYLVRSSQADHNMAIVASKQSNTLNMFTAEVMAHPEVCRPDAATFCSWVPAGVAVRPD